MAERKVPLDHKKGRSSHNSKKNLTKNQVILRKALLAAAVLLLLVVGAFTAVGISYIAGAPPINPELLETLQTSYLFDYQDQEVASLHGEQNRVVIPLAEIPEHVQQAFIAIEDERFDKHFGFDIIGFIRAMFVNLRTMSFSQGASTITQQLVQDAYLSKDQNIERKVQEIWLAIRFESRYSKEEILEYYLNRIYFGQSAYGVEAAAQTFFQKSVDELDYAEAAFLAGLVQLPEYYNPYTHGEERSTNRMKLVLSNMRRLGFIDEEEYQEALQAEFAFGDPPSRAAFPYPHFVDHVVHNELNRILRETYGYERDEAYNDIYTGGLRVYTTMNTEYQARVEEVLNRNELYPQTVYIDLAKAREAIGNLPKGTQTIPQHIYNTLIDEENGVPQPQSAFVLSDPKTGAIWALGGGRDYERSKLLRFNSNRQPGSAIKPIITYAPAFEEGVLGAGSALDDSPMILGSWAPENYDGRFRGWLSTREALAQSYNIPAVRAYQQLGLQKGAEYAQRMGLSNYNPDAAVTSWTLGSKETTAIDMATAYGVLANDGIKIETHTVRRIEDRHGNVIYERKVNPEQVLSPQASFIVNDILKDVVTHTTAAGLRPGRPMAAKTGTTDDARDIYLAAYAPNVVATFWMGYDEMLLGRITQGWGYSTTITREIFNEVLKTLPVEQFSPAPRGVVRVEVCQKSGMLPSELCREAGTVRADYFMANHVPRLTCNLHVEMEVCSETGLLASDFCPEDHLETQVFFKRGDYITTDGRWVRPAGRKPMDADNMPPEDICDMHKEAAGEITSLVGEYRNGNIQLQWSFTGPRLKEFRLVKQVQEEQTGEPIIIQGNIRDYTDRNVQTGRTYVYTLYGVYENGTQTGPATVSINLSENRPGSPENFSANAEGTTVRLSWRYDAISASRFILKRGTDPDNLSVVDDRILGIRRNYDDRNLEPGTTYYYQLMAVSWLGVESLPADANVTMPGEGGGEESTSSINTILSVIDRFFPLLSALRL